MARNWLSSLWGLTGWTRSRGVGSEVAVDPTAHSRVTSVSGVAEPRDESRARTTERRAVVGIQHSTMDDRKHSQDTASSSCLAPDNLFSVRGAVAVVTGGGTGIGLMIATALENNGAIVYIVGRRLHVLEKAARENSKYGNIIPLKGDVTSRDDLLVLAETVKQRSGHINLLVNNAGVVMDSFKPWTPEDCIKSFQERLWTSASPEGYAKTFETNVTAVYFVTVAFMELLHLGNREREGHPDLPTSQVLTVSSVAGLRRDDKQFSLSYALSKAASIQLGKMLANILNGFKIRSNVIAPGIYPSQMTQGVIESMSINSNAVPLQRSGDIQDMGGLVLFLTSRAGAYTNGCVFLTDGGRLSLFPSTY